MNPGSTAVCVVESSDLSPLSDPAVVLHSFSAGTDCKCLSSAHCPQRISTTNMAALKSSSVSIMSGKWLYWKLISSARHANLTLCSALKIEANWWHAGSGHSASNLMANCVLQVFNNRLKQNVPMRHMRFMSTPTCFCTGAGDELLKQNTTCNTY